MTISPSNIDALHDFRCDACGKLLFKGVLLMCTIQIKCRKCQKVVVFGQLINPYIPGSGKSALSGSSAAIDSQASPSTPHCLLLDRPGQILAASPSLRQQFDTMSSPILGDSVGGFFGRLGYTNIGPALIGAWSSPKHAPVRLVDSVTAPNGESKIMKLQGNFIQHEDDEYLLASVVL